jgi:ketosteroid isomerase-like protein
VSTPAEHAPGDRLRDLVQRYAAAVSARDLGAITALLHDEAVQRDPADAAPNIGAAAIGAFFRAAFEASTSTDFVVSGIHSCGDQVAFNFDIEVGLGDTSMHIGGIEVFTVDENTLITAISAFWDQADVRLFG